MFTIFSSCLNKRHTKDHVYCSGRVHVYQESEKTLEKSNGIIPLTSIIHEKNIIVRRYVIGSRLASKAISALPQPNTALTVPAMGPNAFQAQYCANPDRAKTRRI